MASEVTPSHAKMPILVNPTHPVQLHQGSGTASILVLNEKTSYHISNNVDKSITTSNEHMITYKWFLMMAMSSLAMLVGGSTASLLGRLYFVEGGSRRWVYACIQSIGWPILIFPLGISYLHKPIKFLHITPKTISIFALMGLMTALDNILYAWGTSYLPVSTNSLLCSSQLAFNVFFSYILINKRLSFFTINSLVLITMGCVVLVLHSDSDRPPGTTKRQYVSGCILTITASGLYALILALMEIIYTRVVTKRSFMVVMEVQAMVSVIATVFSVMAMWIAGDFAGMRMEASDFQKGRGVYAATLLGSAVGWQIYIVGASSLIFLASSLISSIFMTTLIPVLPILAIFFFHDSFTPNKAISLVLALWGFSSYIYGTYVFHKDKGTKPITQNNNDNETHMQDMNA